MKYLTAKEAIGFLPKKRYIHCFADMIGADWTKGQVVKELKRANKIAWVKDMFKHELALLIGPKSKWRKNSLLRFDVQKPFKKHLQVNKRFCHLCGSEEIKGGWCTNSTCSEYKKYEKL